MRRIGLVISLVALSAMTLFGQSVSTKLQWEFSPGQRYKVQMQQDIEQSIIIHGSPGNSRSDTTMYMTWVVDDVEEAGNAKLTCTIDRMVIVSDVPGVGEVSVDSADMENADEKAIALGKMVLPMIGKPMKQTMSPTGELLSVVIPNDFHEGVNENPIRRFVMNTEQMADMIKKSSPVFPSTGVEPGETWSRTETTDTPAGQLTVETEFEYIGKTKIDGRELHEVHLTRTMNFPPTPNAMGVTIQLEKQEIHGRLYFDVKRGMLYESQVDQDAELVLSAGEHHMMQTVKQLARATFRRE